MAHLLCLRGKPLSPEAFFEVARYFGAPYSETTRKHWVEGVPDVSRLEVFWGKMILELRAPTGLNKGYALRKLVREWDLDAAVFIGDDTTDGDALLALREMVDEGQFQGLGVAVLGEDTPDALIAAADYALNGVGEVATFLQWLDESLARDSR